jgi:Fic family protein
MKIPQRPRNFSDLFNQIGKRPERFGEVFTKQTSPIYHGRYVHWEKLRHLPPPTDLSSEEWWFAIKFARAPLLKGLPLRDRHDNPFRFCVPDPATELLHTLDRDAGGQILLGDRVTTSETRDQYVVNSLMEEAITSSQIEGAATTRVVAKEMLRTGRKPRNRDEQMIANNYAAMRRIRDIKGEPLTPGTILELHRILTTDAMDVPDAVARLRRANEDVRVGDAYGQVLHDPPPAESLDQRIRLMCDFANAKTPNYFIHPVIRAITLHFWLAYDHPFVDGNGRCARALFYWSMLRSGYWLSEFISISQLIRKAQARYGRAFLYTETDDNDLTYFILYHLDLIRRGIDALHDYLQRKMTEVREAERLLRNSDGLNHRQIALLSHALRHPGTPYTIASHQNSHAIVYETARTDLFDLEKRGLLQVQKSGRSYRFFAARDLEQRMKKLK